MKKLISTILFAVSLSTLQANDLCVRECGTGYEDAYTAPNISPRIALGAVVLAAVVTLLVHDGDSHRGGSSHSHSHG